MYVRKLLMNFIFIMGLYSCEMIFIRLAFFFFFFFFSFFFFFFFFHF